MSGLVGSRRQWVFGSCYNVLCFVVCLSVCLEEVFVVVLGFLFAV